ncbi:methyltransferase B [Massariosphaeria phaeospora]|uniref:Methyltransferase B n=1 Tax=Massariosphaeria phaeospora TaxID=100035 RepID=A0A7C8IA59_9PLEO|nr:methyltransferase B [Massariosphaeria phaeospora]
MESIANQIRELFEKANDEERRKIHADIRELQWSLDSDWDLLARMFAGYLQFILLRFGHDLGIFTRLTASSDPITLGAIAAESGASPSLLGHILRAMSSFGLITETSKGTFAANRATRTLSNEHVVGALPSFFECHAPAALAAPAFFKDRKYQSITSNKDLPFQRALNTDLTPFEWLKQNPAQMKSLGHTMALQRDGHWTGSYPVEKEVGSFSPATESALLVDIGGGFGQQSVVFKMAFPSLPGRIVVQDIPETLSRAPTVDGVSFESYDFFTTQPITNAKFYYLRHILHDWTDEDSVRILKAIVPAMGPDSRVVIDEVVLPDENVPWQAAFMDLTMMMTLGGMERTRDEYESLLDQAGLKIVDVHRYDAKMQGVVLAVPK